MKQARFRHVLETVFSVCAFSWMSAHAAGYGLMVGIDNYAPGYALSLPSCVNDANGFGQQLLSDVSRWPAENFTTLTDSAASKTAIREQLAALASETVSGDVVVYFHSSHGGRWSGTDTYVCSHDENYEDYELASDLLAFKTGVKVIIVVDACYSGGLFKNAAGEQEEWNFAANVMKKLQGTRKTKAMLEKGADIGWITAANYNEYSSAGYPYSLLVGYLIDGFQFGDADGNGLVTFLELINFASPLATAGNSGQHAQTLNTALLGSTVAKSVDCISLEEALDVGDSVTLTTGGGRKWVGQGEESFDGEDAARSGTIANRQQSWLQASLTGPVMLSFWWRVSSETDYDFLRFYVDDVEQAGKISGETDWEQRSCQLGAGPHTVKWVYAKDISYIEGNDCGWVDQISFSQGEAFFEQGEYVASGEGNSGIGGVNAVVPVSGVGPVSVSVYVLSATATAADYMAPTVPVKLIWKDGESGVKYVTIPIKGDTLAEGEEVFYLALGKPEGGLIGEQGVCAVVIQDDDEGSVPKKGSFVAGVPQPPEAGRVTGGAYCLPGKTVRLTASPNAGWTFLCWEDGYQGATRTVSGEQAAAGAGNGTMLCTASFKLTTEVVPPQTENPGSQKAIVGLSFDLAVPVRSECLSRVTVTGLPSGLRYDANTVRIDGVPTRPGVFNVTFKASNVAGATSAQTFTLTVAPLPVWAQGTFNGTCTVYHEGEISAYGLSTLSVSSLGAVTGKLAFNGANYAFSASSYVDALFDEEEKVNGFYVSVWAKAGKVSIPLELDVRQSNDESDTGLVPETLGDVFAYGETNGVAVDAFIYRNVWKDAGMAAVVTNYIGYYTAVLPGGSEYGSGYLTFTVDKTGGVKTAGKLADGTAVSLSGTLVLDIFGRIYAVMYSAPATYKGGYLFGLPELVWSGEAGTHAVISRLEGWTINGTPFIWENHSPLATPEYGAIFSRSLDVSGGWYDKVRNLYDYYRGRALSVGTDSGAPVPELVAGVNRYASVWWNLERLAVTAVTNRSGVMTGLAAPKAVSPVKVNGRWEYDNVDNTVGLTLSLVRATGIFKGSFKAWFDYGTTHTSRSLAYEGVLTPERVDMNDGVEGRGYFLWADKSSYDSGKVDKYGEPIMTPYSFNVSYDFLLLDNP